VNPALAPVVEMLEAERVRPVPRARRAVAVDVDDLALVLDALRRRSARKAFPAEVAAAFGRLEMTVRRHP